MPLVYAESRGAPLQVVVERVERAVAELALAVPAVKEQPHLATLVAGMCDLCLKPIEPRRS